MIELFLPVAVAWKPVQQVSPLWRPLCLLSHRGLLCLWFPLEMSCVGERALAPSCRRLLSQKHLALYSLYCRFGQSVECAFHHLPFLIRIWCQEESWWVLFFLIFSEYQLQLWDVFEGPWVAFPLTYQVFFKNCPMSLSIIFSSSLFETFCLLRKCSFLSYYNVRLFMIFHIFLPLALSSLLSTFCFLLA